MTVSPKVCVVIKPLDTGLTIFLPVGDRLMLDATETVQRDAEKSDYQ